MQARYAVVDVETSGLSAHRHRVLQVAVVTVTASGEIVDRFSSFVAPRHRWLPFRVGPRHIHGISRHQLRRAPAAHEVLIELAARIGDATVVAHNAPFDVAFLRAAAERARVELPLDKTLCTLDMSRRLDPERHLSHRLADVCSRYGVQLTRAHDALADATATAGVLPHLLRATAAQRSASGSGSASDPASDPASP